MFDNNKTLPTEMWMETCATDPGLQNIGVIVQLFCALVASTAEVERGVSKLNLLKTPKRSRLGRGVTDKMLFIQHHGPPLRQWDWAPALDKWDETDHRFNQSKRKRKSKPRKPLSIMMQGGEAVWAQMFKEVEARCDKQQSCLDRIGGLATSTSQLN